MNTQKDERRQAMDRDQEVIFLFSKYIRELREQRGLSQEEAAELLGVRQGTYARFELGTRNVTLGLAIKICQLYNVELKDFLASMPKQK